MLKDFLDMAGVKASIILAGFAGSIGRIGLLGYGTGIEGVRWWVAASQIIFSILGGTAAAAYLGPIGPSYLGWPDDGKATLAITFLVGMFGVEICKQIGTAITRWSPSIAKGPKDA